MHLFEALEVHTPPRSRESEKLKAAAGALRPGLQAFGVTHSSLKGAPTQ